MPLFTLACYSVLHPDLGVTSFEQALQSVAVCSVSSLKQALRQITAAIESTARLSSFWADMTVEYVTSLFVIARSTN